MTKRIVSLVCVAAAGVVLALAAYVTAVNLIEAYGSGPPHYVMTTNMDKWESRVGFLALA
nr:hypothetical protein [uncultured Caldimonas sp.]